MNTKNKTPRALLFVISALIFSSCTLPLRYYPGTVGIRTVDFREYNDKGFLFTYYEYTLGDFESIGIIRVDVSPQSFVNDEQGRKLMKAGAKYDLIRTLWSEYPILVERTEMESFLKIMYDEATALGADAIVDLSLESTLEQRDFGTVYNHTIRGYAIKRK